MHAKEFIETFKKHFPHLPFTSLQEAKKWRRLLALWQRIARRLLPLCAFSAHNHVQLYHDGDAAFLAMKDAIDRARQRVCLESYMIAADKVGLFFKEALLEARKRGCDVMVIYDHVGSAGLPANFFKSLVKEGGHVIAFNPIWPWRRKGPLLFRDHRKILIVDGQVAFCGSLNLTEDYGGAFLGKNRFRDTAIRIEGPAVEDLTKLFNTSLLESSGQKIETAYRGPTYEDGVMVQVLGSNERRHLRGIQKSMCVTLARARTACFLATPYFLPYGSLKRALLKATGRGVDVRILTAGFSDVPLMRLASQHVYGQFLRKGIRLYEMHGKTLHAKTATIDGIYASVGSFNLDHWSARRNLEVTASVMDPKIAHDVRVQFESDLLLSREIHLKEWEKRSWYRRIVSWCAYQLMRL